MRAPTLRTMCLMCNQSLFTWTVGIFLLVLLSLYLGTLTVSFSPVCTMFIIINKCLFVYGYCIRCMEADSIDWNCSINNAIESSVLRTTKLKRECDNRMQQCIANMRTVIWSTTAIMGQNKDVCKSTYGLHWIQCRHKAMFLHSGVQCSSLETTGGLDKSLGE